MLIQESILLTQKASTESIILKVLSTWSSQCVCQTNYCTQSWLHWPPTHAACRSDWAFKREYAPVQFLSLIEISVILGLNPMDEPILEGLVAQCYGNKGDMEGHPAKLKIDRISVFLNWQVFPYRQLRLNRIPLFRMSFRCDKIWWQLNTSYLWWLPLDSYTTAMKMYFYCIGIGRFYDIHTWQRIVLKAFL